MKKRLRVNFTGQVQGVGFRYTARSLAHELGLTGWVRNTNEGGVELVAEGEEVDLKALLDRLVREMNYTNFRGAESWEPASGEFLRFEIRY